MKAADYEFEFTNLVSPFDIRDYKVAVTAVSFPDSFVLPEVTVKNQGRTGSCVAHACSSVVEFHNKRQENTDIVFSTEFIYGYRPTGYYVGEGMYIRNALKTLYDLGDCPLADLAGNQKCPEAMKAVEANLEELKNKAYPHRISTYARVKTADEIKQALMDFGYVVASMKWPKTYELKDGVFTNMSNEFKGSHCIVLYGWDERGWLAHNSWGIGWGQNGKFIIPFDVAFKEAWAVTDNIVGEGAIIRPEDNWFISNFGKLINTITNFFRKFFNLKSSKI